MGSSGTSSMPNDRPKEDLRPIPEVPDIDCQSYTSEYALVHDIIEGMRIAGLCVVRQIVKPNILAKIRAEMRPHVPQAATTPGDFWPRETTKISSMLSKSETYALHLVGHPVWQRVGEYFLTSTLENYWNGDKIVTSVSKPQLNNTQGFIIGPGARAQGLHRDDIVYHNQQGYAENHTLGRDRGMGLFVADTPTNRSNGATRFIPGSHLWDYDVLPSESLAVQPELQPGDGVMMLSGLFHGGSSNESQEPRVVWAAFTTRGWIRQEENQYLCNDVEAIKRLPLWLQMFCGWSISKPFMGWVELDNPIKVLHPEYEVDDDPYY